MDDTKKKSAIELQFNDTLVARSENVCDNYTASLSSLQEEITTKFVGKKLQTETLGAVYSILDLEKRSSRVFDCGSFLEFKVTQDNAKLQHANFCKDRLCPMCNWRRSKKIFSQASAVMDYMGDYQFLFLTLTVKNCSAQDLPKTVQVLFDGWRYLYNKNKIFYGLKAYFLLFLNIIYPFYFNRFWYEYIYIVGVIPASTQQKTKPKASHKRGIWVLLNSCIKNRKTKNILLNRYYPRNTLFLRKLYAQDRKYIL